MKRLKVVSDWAARVLENGPREARSMAEIILDEADRMILFHRDRDPGDLLDELAERADLHDNNRSILGTGFEKTWLQEKARLDELLGKWEDMA